MVKLEGKKMLIAKVDGKEKEVGSDCLCGREVGVMPGSTWGREWQFALFDLCGGDQIRSVYFSAH